LTYFWVGVGGALGSIARYWMALAVLALTGPAFPWGTILINILGSFVIAFFGTLTGVSGALNVHSDVRAFVMVGICGGFTTFSSFSLQTLDLAREGRLLYALANITASVVLCLAAVTIGYTVASYINSARSL
jgi:CrcB protein